MTSWGPSWWGRVFRGADAWSVQVQPDVVRIQSAGVVRTFPVTVAERITIRPGWVWSTVTVDDPGRPMQLTGISNVAAASLRTSLTSTLARHRYIAGLRRAFTDGTALIQGWSQALEQEQRSWEHRWWPRELIAAWQASKC